MKTKVYVDGQHGTAGLEVHKYLSIHPYIDLIEIDFDDRHDKKRRKACLNEADIVILCLPNEGSREAVSLIDNNHTKVIDASTEYRTNDDWVYGLPELEPGHRDKIKSAMRVANPGCHATASILTLRPLVYGGHLSTNYPVSLYSITGYSGGGKRLIYQYEEEHEDYLNYPRPYGLPMTHKHVPEIVKHVELRRKPLFSPIVGDYFRGLATNFMVHLDDLDGFDCLEDVVEFYKDYYRGEAFVTVRTIEDESSVIKHCFFIGGSNFTNRADIFIYGNDEQVSIFCRVDNLGKGAGGAAIQNMNIMIDCDEMTSLLV